MIVLDEVSMVGEEMARDLLAFGKPILVLGDPGQLPPIKGEGAFTQATPDIMLTEIHRQAGESAIIHLATLAREHKPIPYGEHDTFVWKMPRNRAQDSLNPPYDDSSNGDCGLECVSASVISGCNAPPVFKFCEHVFDFMTLLIKRFIILDFDFAVFFGWHAWLYAFSAQSVPEPIGIITAICKQHIGFGHSIQQMPSAFVIAHLPFGQEHGNRPAQTITNSMKFGVQAAFCAPNSTGNIPFLSRLAAVLCALRWVASI